MKQVTLVITAIVLYFTLCFYLWDQYKSTINNLPTIERERTVDTFYWGKTDPNLDYYYDRDNK